MNRKGHLLISTSRLDFNIEASSKSAINEWVSEIRQVTEVYEKKAFGSTGGYAIAPMGGSKIRGFRELGLRGLVVIDLIAPGDLSAVKALFRKPAVLKKAIQDGIFGGMDTVMVRNSSPVAQMIAKLYAEMEVSNFKIRFYRSASETGSVPIVKIDFEWEGKSREIIYIQRMLELNSSAEPAIPGNILRSLRPSGFRYLYISADGVSLFNADPRGSDLEKASSELLATLEDGGGVLLDYPFDRWNSVQSFSHEFFERRADLEKWGFQRLATFHPHANFPIFGYSVKPHEDVRLYIKPAATPRSSVEEQQSFSTDDLMRVGEAIDFRFVP